MNRLSLTQRVLPTSLIILIACTLGLGWWAGQHIEQKLVTQAAGETALYVSSLISLPLPELAAGEALTQEHINAMARLVGPTPLGHQIVAFKIWNPQGVIIFSTDSALIGRQFPVKEDLARALRGEVVYGVSDLSDLENFRERDRFDNLLEIYSPVQARGTNEVTAVIEYYQSAEVLQQQLRQAQLSNWKLIGGITAGAGLLLAGVVSLGNSSVVQQTLKFKRQVAQLSEQLRKNEETAQRMRQGGAGTLGAQERLLRRATADLRAGPIHLLAGALGHLAQMQQQLAGGAVDEAQRAATQSTQAAYDKLLALAADLALPEIEDLPLALVVRQAVTAHEQSAKTFVAVEVDDLPEGVSASTKLLLYRVTSEVLACFERLASGVHPRLRLEGVEDVLRLELVVAGEVAETDVAEARWRVESVGGSFGLERHRRRDARVLIEIPLHSGQVTWS